MSANRVVFPSSDGGEGHADDICSATTFNVFPPLFLEPAGDMYADEAWHDHLLVQQSERGTPPSKLVLWTHHGAKGEAS